MAKRESNESHPAVSGDLASGRSGPDLTVLTDKEREYLEVIYYLAARGEPVIAARLADWLKVRPPTVTHMLQRLVQKGYVQREDAGPVGFTAEGQLLAVAIVRRHRLLECFLVDVMGMPWHVLHEEAMHLEHGMSPLMEQQIETLVGTKETCPHGNPVPGNRDSYPGTVRLDAAPVGRVFALRRIVEEAEEDTDLMQYLQSTGFLPGTSLNVISSSPKYGTVLEGNGQQVAISADVASVLWGEVK